jgi:hypothetical protein
VLRFQVGEEIAFARFTAALTILSAVTSISSPTIPANHQL